MNVELINSGQVLTVRIKGDIDHHSAKYIREKIDSSITANGTKKLVLDFSRVTFMDSSGIGLVMGRYALLSKYGGEIHIVEVNRVIYKVMELANLTKIATISQKSNMVHS